MKTITLRDAPASWFEREAYRPRLSAGGREAWFILSPELAPLTAVPDAAPREPDGGRAALRGALEETYASWKLPRTPAVDRSIMALGETGTAAVVAGQQPGFLGGPLLAAFKALSAVASARRYESLTGRACVPVFWVAADDHDLEEVREARFPAVGGGEAVFRFPGEPDRRPLSEYTVDAAVEEVLEAAAKQLETRRHGARARALVALYRGRSLASGFAAILAELLGHAGLVVIDPATLRPAAADVFRRVIEEPDRMLALIEAGRREVQSKGVAPFVPARLPLFFLGEGRRDHLSPAGGGLQVDGGGRFHPRRELLGALAANPRLFSPGALLRPIVQQRCLPSVLTLGGAAEVGYFAQLGPLAGQFDLPRPPIALRFNATLFDGKPARLAGRLDPEVLARARSPLDLLSPEAEPPALRAAREAAARAGEDIIALTREAAPSDRERLEKRARRLAADVSRLTEQVTRSRAARRSLELEEATRLYDAMLPGGELQERRWGIIHFIAKHGAEWVDEVIAAESRDPVRLAHRWVEFAG